MVADKLFTKSIQIGGAHTGLHMGFHEFKGAGGEDGTLPDTFNLFRCFNPYGHGAKIIALLGYCLKED